MWTWTMALAALVMADTPPQKPLSPAPTEAGKAAAVAWLKADAHLFSGADAPSDELKPIADRLAGARVIGLGEATHGDHEDQQFKANLIKQLVRDGDVTAVVLEANRDAAEGFDAYVRRGDGDPVALLRSPSVFRVTRDEEFASLLVWLRAWNQTTDHPVRIFGIDDQDAGRDASLALALISRHDPALAARLKAPFTGLIPADGKTFPKASYWVIGQTTAQIAMLQAAARTLSDTVIAHKADWGHDPGYTDAAYAAEVAWQCFNIFEKQGKDAPAGVELSGSYYARRDIFMAKNLLHRLADGERAVIWAHDGHVADTLPPAYEAAGGSSLGRELHGAIGGAYRGLGTTWSQGRVNAVAGPMDKIRSDMPETAIAVTNDGPRGIGSVFNPLSGPAAWVDLKARPHTPELDQWVKSDYFFGQAGWGLDPATFQTDPPGAPDEVLPVDQGFDVLVWFRVITPARRLPERPR